MKYLNGLELAGFIKERQAHEVRSLRQAKKIIPKLAIIVCSDNPVIRSYVKHKQKYGADILVEVDVYKIDQNDAKPLVEKLNKDKTVHGIIVQLPLANPEQTDEIVNTINSKKDVDGLGEKGVWDPATPMAILWLLAGYNINLEGKKVTLVGRGRLVGKPLRRMLEESGIAPEIIHSQTSDPVKILQNSEIVITAVGKPGIIKPDDLSPGCVVVDAAVADDGGQLKGDLDPTVYNRDDIIATPIKGGVGPLTICALFDNVIRAARLSKTSD